MTPRGQQRSPASEASISPRPRRPSGPWWRHAPGAGNWGVSVLGALLRLCGPAVNSPCPQGGAEKRPCGVTARGCQDTLPCSGNRRRERKDGARFSAFPAGVRVRVHAQLRSTKEKQPLQRRVVDTWGPDADGAGGRAPCGCSWSCGLGRTWGPCRAAGGCASPKPAGYGATWRPQRHLKSPSCSVHGAFGPKSQRVRKLEAEGRAVARRWTADRPTGRKPHASAVSAA